MKTYIIILTALCILFSCDPDKNDLPKLEMGDVHITDANANLVGGASDQNEWKMNIALDEEVEQYFTGDFSLCSSVGNSQVYSPFPNPTDGSVIMTFALDVQRDGEIIIIDNCYEKVLEVEHDFVAGNNTIAIDLSSLNGGETYRMFYVFTNSSCALAGYGDIHLDL